MQTSENAARPKFAEYFARGYWKGALHRAYFPNLCGADGDVSTGWYRAGTGRPGRAASRGLLTNPATTFVIHAGARTPRPAHARTAAGR